MAEGKNGISRQIVKAMSVFGGVQVLGILCSIIRTKFVAVWIGPVGIGLFGLYNTAIDMICNISNLGIRSSSVRDISIEHERGTREHIAQIIDVVRHWTWALGVIAAFFTLIASSWLSQLTFGDHDHIWGFIALSVVVMFSALMNCEQSILQGTRRLKRLAEVSLYGSIVGLTISVPLFYFLREQSIVPSIIAYSAATALFAWLFRNKDYSDIKTNLPYREIFSRGTGFVKLGFMLMLGSFLSLLSFYIFIAYLNHQAGTETVGYYQSGYTLINRYAGLIFTAIGTEYFPRLARVCHSRLRTVVYVNQEINITMTVLIPILTLLLLFRSLIVSILYSSDFHTIIPFISFATIGIIFEGISWCMAFVIIAKGKGRIYIITESISTVVGLVLNIAFYNYGGITALGWAYALWYIIYTVIIGVVYFGTFRLTLNRNTLLLSLYALAVISATIIAMESHIYWLAAIIAIAAITISALSLRRQLSKR